MADGDGRSDIERLLAEADSVLGGGSPAPTKRQPSATAASRQRTWATSVQTATIAGAVAAGAVWLIFAFLPFLGSLSGSAGAFLGTFFAVLVLRRR